MSTILSSPLPQAKTSSQAVWSLVLGILSMTCLWLLGSIPAIILGILAIKAVDASGGTLKGRGLGIAGIVTGGIGVLSGIGTMAILASISLPAYSGARNKAMQVHELSQVKQIVIACQLHAADKNGTYPETLEALLEEGYVDASVLEPKSVVGGTFLYRPGLVAAATGPDEPVVASPVPLHGNRVVGLSDGRAEIVTEEQFQADYAHLFP